MPQNQQRIKAVVNESLFTVIYRENEGRLTKRKTNKGKNKQNFSTRIISNMHSEAPKLKTIGLLEIFFTQNWLY